MQVEKLAIPEVLLLTPRVFSDARGFFMESYNRRTLADVGITDLFVQDNHVLSRDAGVVRGLHLQAPPIPQGKLVRVVKGAIFDVAVDVRHGSPTFAQHVGVTITAESFHQIWVPPGFLHGYATLEPDTEVIYKVTGPYAPECDRGVQWNDPALAIRWPIAAENAILSAKDKAARPLADHPAYFRYAP